MAGLKYLIFDEADRLFSMDFEKEIDKLLESVPRQGRQTMLYSATMTAQVEREGCLVRLVAKSTHHIHPWASRR